MGDKMYHILVLCNFLKIQLSWELVYFYKFGCLLLHLNVTLNLMVSLL